MNTATHLNRSILNRSILNRSILKCSILKCSILKCCILLIGSLILSAPAAAQNEVPNAGFEDWSGADLDFWNVNPDGGTPNAVPSADAHGGEIAVLGEVSAGNLFPVLHTTLPFPISENYNYLVGYYKFDPQGQGDYIRIDVSLWNDDADNFSLKVGQLVIGSAASEWTQFVVPIPGEISGSTLVGSIEILLGNDPQPAEGSYFLVDDLSLLIDSPGTQPPPAPDFYEITHEIIDGFGWFGGDDRPTQGPRHVGVGQSVLVDQAMTVERFSFYFRGPFDYSTMTDGTSNTVTLVLNVRHAAGTILRTLQTVVPDSFTEGWVTWDGIDLDVPANTSLIFTTYLVGAYDVLQVKASQGADVNASYSGGERFGKDGVSDADMEDWTDWGVHQFWDSAFRLEGTLSPPAPDGQIVMKAMIPGIPVADFASTPNDGWQIEYASNFDFGGDGKPNMPFFLEDEQGATTLAVVDAADYTVWRNLLSMENPTVIGYYELNGSNDTKEVVIASKQGQHFLNPAVIDAEGNLLSVWDDTDIVHLQAIVDLDGDGHDEVVVFNPQSSQVEIWGEFQD